MDYICSALVHFLVMLNAPLTHYDVLLIREEEEEEEGWGGLFYKDRKRTETHSSDFDKISVDDQK